MTISKKVAAMRRLVVSFCEHAKPVDNQVT